MQKDPSAADLVGPFGLTLTQTVGAPEIELVKLSDLEQVMLQIRARQAEVRLFRNWNPSPLRLTAGSGQVLATISEMVLSIIRAVDEQTGVLISFQTLVFRRTSNGWKTAKREEPPIRLLTFTAAGGALDDWVSTSGQVIECGDDQIYTTYRKEFRPDWFDVAGKGVMTVGPGTFYRC
jgi:hypothetical protein